MRQRPLATLLLAVAACASSRATAPRPPSATTATGATNPPPISTTAVTRATTAGPAPALAAYVAGLPHTVADAGPAPSGATLVAVVARQLSPTDRVVEVLTWSGASWAPTATLTLPTPPYSLANLPVQVADVTGDGRPDFLVRVDAADNQPGVVVSGDGGTWRLVPLAAAATANGEEVYAGRDPAFQGGHLTTQYDNCTPDCAQGTTTTVTWAYDRAAGRFVTAGA